jgi:hypothetical protein
VRLEFSVKVFPVDWKVKLSNSSKEPGWLLLVGLEKRVMRHRLAAPLGLKGWVLIVLCSRRRGGEKRTAGPSSAVPCERSKPVDDKLFVFSFMSKVAKGRGFESTVQKVPTSLLIMLFDRA